MLDADNPRVRRKQRGHLWYFETSSVPRPGDVCARYARKIAPWWGFAVYGVLYFFVAFFALFVGVFIGIGVKELLGIADATTPALFLSLGFGLVAFGFAWWPFVLWVKRRRAAAWPLIRDGMLLDGVVVGNLTGSAAQVAKRLAADFIASQVGRVKFYRVAFEHEGPRMLQIPTTTFAVPAANTPVTVLFHPSSKYALVFDEAGRLAVATVRG